MCGYLLSKGWSGASSEGTKQSRRGPSVPTVVRALDRPAPWATTPTSYCCVCTEMDGPQSSCYVLNRGDKRVENKKNTQLLRIILCIAKNRGIYTRLFPGFVQVLLALCFAFKDLGTVLPRSIDFSLVKSPAYWHLTYEFLNKYVSLSCFNPLGTQSVFHILNSI